MIKKENHQVNWNMPGFKKKSKNSQNIFLSLTDGKKLLKSEVVKKTDILTTT